MQGCSRGPTQGVVPQRRSQGLRHHCRHFCHHHRHAATITITGSSAAADTMLPPAPAPALAPASGQGAHQLYPGARGSALKNSRVQPGDD